MKKCYQLAVMWMCINFLNNSNCVNSHKTIFSSIANILISDLKDITNSIEFDNINSSSTRILRNYRYDNVTCATHFMHFLEALAREELWAIKIADSWGKIPSGILYGNVFEPGNFDQCLDQGQTDNISSQYCLAQLVFDYDTIAGSQNSLRNVDVKNYVISTKMLPPQNDHSIGINIGICVPSTCSPQFLPNLIDKAISKLNLTVKTFISEDLCHQKELHNELRPIDIFSVSVFSIAAMLMIASTIYDILRSRINKVTSLSLIAFSMYTNGKQMFRCRRSKSTDLMDCLNGIRALSIIWIVYGHTHMMVELAPMINSIDILQWITHYHSMLTVSAFIAVDTFFLLSGLLVAWSILKQLDRNKGKLNIFWLYFHRYIRLTPVLAATVLFCSTLLRRLGSGPLWNTSLYVADELCYQYWWSTLLYVQNYVNPSHMCLGPSWYLAVDMQLFILSPILLYPLWRWRHKFVWIIPLLIALSMACNFTTFMVYGFIITRNDNGKGGPKLEKTYYPTHIRMGAWLVGLLLGYILHNMKGKKVTLPKVWTTIGWIISIGSILAIVFGVYPMSQQSYHVTVLESAFYDSFSRVSWAIAVSWIIFACVHGYGGPVNWLLSIPQWQPIARLSYTIYIIHLPIMLVLTAAMRVPRYFSDVVVIHKFWGDFGLTFTVAIIWSMAFESPFLILEKIITGIKTKPASKSEPQKEVGTEKQTV